jgi:hypothetical protein
MRGLSILGVLLSVGGLLLPPAGARADSGPVIVIPSRPGIPVAINGVDASYAVVEGDWGLSRPGAGTVTVFGGRPLYPTRVYRERNSYHPAYGRPPARGRHEIEPPADRELPPQAESFSRSWSTSSDPLPASTEPMTQAWPSQSDDAGAMPPRSNDTKPSDRRFKRSHHDTEHFNRPRGHRGHL